MKPACPREIRPGCFGLALVSVLAVVDQVENVRLQTALCEVKSGALERAAAAIATMHDAYMVNYFLMRTGSAFLLLLGGKNAVDRRRGNEAP